MRKLIFAVGAVVLLAAAAVYATPYVVVWRLREAVERRDSDAIASHVDFPALRESLKASLSKSMEHMTTRGPLAGLPFGTALAGSVIEPMVDAMVTPEAVASMLNGEKPSVLPSFSVTMQKPDLTLGYEDWSTFVATVQQPGQPFSIDAIFTRDGLSWKLRAVRLPL